MLVKLALMIQLETECQSTRNSNISRCALTFDIIKSNDLTVNLGNWFHPYANFRGSWNAYPTCGPCCTAV